jgi:ribosomal-protein-alanine N-acetyltransferase
MFGSWQRHGRRYHSGMKSDPFPPVETRRLRLRCLSIDDAPAVASMMTPEISRWVAAWPIPFSREMAEARIEASRQAARAGNALPFAVADKTNDDFMGWLSIYRNKEHLRRGSVGYWLGEKHQGKGYMREAVSTALAAAFERLNLDIIEALVQPENGASIALIEACGMTPTGERMHYAAARQRDEPCVVYELRRPSWNRISVSREA